MPNEKQVIEDLAVFELVDLLLDRYELTNGFEFITPDQKQALLDALHDPETAAS